MKILSAVVKKPGRVLALSAMCAALYSTQGLAADAFSYESPYMFGDWGGTRTQLEKDGVKFSVNYTMEAASNLAGGYNTSTTARYSDQQAFGVNLDLEKLLDWQDAEFQLTITNRDGQNLSDEIADPRTGMVSSVQEVWGRGQTWRLTQMWLRKGFFDDMLDIKAGRLTVGEDFGSFDSKFENLAFGSGQGGNWRGDHWYNWPVSQWATRVRLNFTPELFLQVGFYNQNPYNYAKGDGFRFEFNPTEGNLVPVELGWQPKLGAEGLPGNYRIGYYYSSTKDPVYGSYRNGGYGTTDEHSYGGYIVAQQQLTSQGGSVDRGLGITVQAVMNDHKTSKTDNYQSVALTWKGPFDARPKDEIGFGVARIHVNSDYSSMLRTQNHENGISNYNNPAYLPIQSGAEWNYEVYYDFHVTNWMSLRPNLQYITSPGAVSEVDDAFVGGLTANISF
ncbi:porin [Salmonella enterica subsp. enterica serovar Choleraesuis]|nr:porin [Salmonella enterica subsp. enterica serovar Choleraesuis]